MANLFLVSGDALLTPSLASGCRAGVTREAVLALAPRLGLSVREEQLAHDALFTADEAFFTSTRVECLPIAAVDGRSIGAVASSHPRTTALRAELRALIKGETAVEAVSWRRGTA